MRNYYHLPLNKLRFLKQVKTIFTSVFILLFSFHLSAQTSVSGTVLSEDGEGLPGVNVVIKGTTTGSVTDYNGKFTINASKGDILQFSFVGYKNLERTVGDVTEFTITLKEDYTSLEEVVVVGYGSQRKADLTGSVAVVNAKEMQKLSTNDISQQLQGRTPGVTVTTDGQPGAVPTVRLRGVTTFGDGAPLYVIDGVPIQGVPRDFNPNDVESMQVLKDASAASIYGALAANGVIIITTKKGGKGQPLTVNYNGYYGVDNVWQRIPVAGVEEYRELNAEVRNNAVGGPIPLAPGNDPNSAVYINDVNTDWQEAALTNGMRQNHNFGFSGGGENTTYFMSLDYLQNQGTFVGRGPDYERYSARINTTAEKGRFKVGTNLYYANSHENSLTFRDDILLGGISPLAISMLQAIPTMKVYDDNNLGGFGGTEAEIHDVISLNVVGVNNIFTNWIDVDKIYANGFGEIDLINSDGHDLTYRINLGWEKTQTRDYAFQPAFDMGYFFNSNLEQVNDNTRTFNTRTIENIIKYKKDFGKHGVEATLAQSQRRTSFLARNAASFGLATPYYPVVWNGATPEITGGVDTNYLNSYMVRLNYNYDDRYLVTLTGRRDASSKFSPANRVGFFPAASFGWRLSNESFFTLDKDFFTDVKLRASYGVLGNENIAPYQYITTINRNGSYNFNNVRVPAATQRNIVDENIKWEETRMSNIALDLVLLNGKVDASIEYFNKITDDILVGVPIPLTTGSENARPITNAGKIQNQGIEFMVGYHYVRGDFALDVDANYSYIKNEVLALGGNEEPIYGVGSRTEAGEPVAQHYGYVYDGLFQSQQEIDDHAFQTANTAPGDVRFRDLNNDDVIDENDRTYLGNSVPKHLYGLNLRASYKNFDFTSNFSGAGGYLINSNLYRSLMHTSGYSNWHEDIYDRWTPENTNTDIPRLVADDPNQNNRNSDRPGWLQNGTYLRVNILQLGYTLPSSAFGDIFRRARVYASAQNLYTFTGYKGYNPDYATPDPFSLGFSFGSYPRPRTFLVGVELTF